MILIIQFISMGMAKSNSDYYAGLNTATQCVKQNEY